jgi:seryl-tRNA synthetase
MAYRIIIAALLFASPVLAQNPLSPTLEGGSRPVPDPTVLTLQSQERALSAQRELFDARFKALEDEVARIKVEDDKVDQRLILRADGVPALIEAAINQSQTLTAEKFRGVADQFAGRDVALAAALLAQKTSVDEQNKANAASSAKQEGAITKQIEGIQAYNTANSKGTDDKLEGVKALLAGQTKSLDDKINDVRKTVDDLRATMTTTFADIRATSAASTARGEGQNQVWVYLIAGGSLLIAFAGVVLPRLHSQQQQQYPPYPPYPQSNSYPPPPQVSVVPVVPVGVPAAPR